MAASALIAGARSAVIQSRPAGRSVSSIRALVSSPRSPTITTRCSLNRCFSLSICDDSVIALVHRGREADRVACHLFRLRDADGDRLGDSDHQIERPNGDCDFSLLSCERAGTQRAPMMLL